MYHLFMDKIFTYDWWIKKNLTPFESQKRKRKKKSQPITYSFGTSEETGIWIILGDQAGSILANGWTCLAPNVVFFSDSHITCPNQWNTTLVLHDILHSTRYGVGIPCKYYIHWYRIRTKIIGTCHAGMTIQYYS